ncbi:cytochrome P450 [Actinomadura verrucosospora]|uniref:Cytochrome P450 144A4 Cyp144A4 n=1 Tax=Actinomadura verrucosospora TaxID=46165 RepID=A0A7D3VQY2_ACTVE|nr:cytochrome P450 [Actinomadura verrucosospora]QKG20039.1 cytochrome P450 144A4 Cyp144A4 [Actinomadura verrucosospora]
MKAPAVSEDLFSPEALADPHPRYQRLRERGPVHLLPDLGLHLVVAHEQVLRALEDPAVFSSNLAGLLAAGPGGTDFVDMGGAAVDVLATVDPPRHTGQRATVAPAFTRRTVAELSGQIQDLLHPRVTALARRGGGDWMAEVAAPVPVLVISRILGLPESDADQITAWSDAAIELLSGLAGPDRMRHLAEQILQVMRYLDERLTRAAARPCGGLLDTLAQDRTLTQDERVQMALQLVTAGSESTTSLLGAAARTLADDQDLAGRLRDDPDQIEAFVEETLRLHSPFRGHFRVTTRDTELGGVHLPARSRLMLLWGAVNRDPAAFSAPHTLDLDRSAIKSHTAFGRGIHFCIGAHLARLEAVLAVRILLDQGAFHATSPAQYVPSLMIRRLTHLNLAFTPSNAG